MYYNILLRLLSKFEITLLLRFEMYVVQNIGSMQFKGIDQLGA